MVTYGLMRLSPADRIELEAFAHVTGLHSELVRRWVKLGLLDASTDSRGRMWLPASELATVARIQRLRAGFPLNYAALGLVIDLLDRIAELEAALREHSSSGGDNAGGDIPGTRSRTTGG